MIAYALFAVLIGLVAPYPGNCMESNANNKLGDVMKNHTKSSYNATKNQNEEENPLKVETHKLLQDCGVETSDSNNYDDSYSNNNNNNRRGYNKQRRDNNNDFNNRRKSPSRRYSNQESNENGNRYNNNRNDRNNNRRGYRNENYSDEEDSNESGSGYKYKRYNRSRECKEDRNQWSNTDGGYGSYDGRGYSSYNNNGNIRRGGGNLPGYGRNLDANLRAKRANNDESQCTSQCVFGYLEVLDDNRVPSETLLIKWLQEHFSSNDMKRIRALRDARRCFARLTTSDVEDGCDFSQSLSKCLNLELE